jgi:hypothetical protein
MTLTDITDAAHKWFVQDVYIHMLTEEWKSLTLFMKFIKSMFVYVCTDGFTGMKQICTTDVLNIIHKKK